MNKLLVVTRWLHALAVKLHLSGLGAAIRADAAKLAAAVKRSDFAEQIVVEAEKSLAIAEREVGAAAARLSSTKSAAVAEADQIAVDHSVGA